jgi:hypothetical protein
MVRNAGHILPYDQPKWAFDMIQRFIQDKDFWTALCFHVSTKLIHNGIKIMICYKQYQWQFIEAQWVQGAYGEPAFEVLYEIFYIVQPNNIFKKLILTCQHS